MTRTAWGGAETDGGADECVDRRARRGAAPGSPGAGPRPPRSPRHQVFVDSDKANGALSVPWSSGEISDKAGLEALAKKLNPVVGYWGEQLSLAFFFFWP